MNLMRWHKQAFFTFLIIAFSNTVQGQQSFQSCDLNFVPQTFGPLDYRTASPQDIGMVERAHFTPKVESLRGGNTSMTPAGDLIYTLWAIPNHHRALMAIIKYAEKEKSSHPGGMSRSVTCYFDRAERFKPDDAMVKSIYGIYLIRSGKPQAGKEKLVAALSLAGENANIYYNIGLAYFDMKQYDKSLDSAHRAYTLGFPLPGLRDKLKRADKWQEPVLKKNLPVDEADKVEAPEIPAK